MTAHRETAPELCLTPCPRSIAGGCDVVTRHVRRGPLPGQRAGDPDRPVRWEVLRSLGYFGGAAIAVCAGLIEPPLGAVIAAVPLIKVLTNQALPVAVRAVGEILEGAAKPIGSDAEGVVRLEGPPKTQEHHG